MSTTPELGMFFRAVRAGEHELVRSMVAATGELVRATDPACFGSTALIYGVRANDRAMVDLLLELGADVDQRSEWWAGSFGVLDDASDEMSAYLLGRGATLTPHGAARLGMVDELRTMLAATAGAVHMRGGDGQMPLHFARTAEVADLLLAHGADIDARDIDHASTAAQWRSDSHPLVAAHLVARGAGTDPFLAARIGDLSLLERLVGAEPLGVHVRVSRDRFPALPPAAGHIYLFTIGEGSTLLHGAAGANQAGVVRRLAAMGADVNARGGYDDGTALHAAAWGDRAECVGALLDAGAEINAMSGRLHRNEPIGWAIVSGAANALRVLLERGAAVRDAHRDDARKGAQGAFRELNRQRPIDSWREVARLLAER